MKPDADEILATLDRLRGASWLGRQRASWPDNLYHIADVTNVASILRTGKVYSRDRAVELDLMQIDSADQAVIAHSEWSHRYVRLYFGPRTPTQYRSEGIRPTANRINGAHTPLPAFLIFDSRALLIRDACQFSNGNVGSSRHQRGSDAAFFASIPFRDVYHRGVFTERGPEIIHRRNAEVLFEDELDLHDLREVVCRTGPERETLLNLLGRDDALRWKNRIRVEARDEGLFERKWYYVQEVSLIGNELHVRMNKPCPMEQRLDVVTDDGTRMAGLQPWSVEAGSSYMYNLRRVYLRVAAKLTIGDSLAYAGTLGTQSVF